MITKNSYIGFKEQIDPDKNLLRRMLAINGFFTSHIPHAYHRSDGDYPMFMNFKETWRDPDVVMSSIQILTNMVKKLAKFDSISLIGVESGGVPYASLMQQNLKGPYISARKLPKIGETDLLTNSIPDHARNIVLVDDIIATGNTVEPVIKQLVERGIKKSDIQMITLMSYGLEMILSTKFGISITSFYQVEDLLDILPNEKYPVAALRREVKKKQQDLKDTLHL